METRIADIGSPEALLEAGEIIRAGGLVAFATETVYGLGADARNSAAVRSVFTVKGRPQDNPLIVHLDSSEKIPEVCARMTGPAEALAERFMPGPLTLVLPRRDCIAPEVSCGLSTVAVRVPGHAGARAFLAACGVPVAAPSANTSTRPSPTRAAHVFSDLAGKIPLILDGGDCGVGIESTVVDVTGEVPVLLRPGIVSLEELEEAVGPVRVKTTVAEGGAALSPGMKYRHYAPSCEMALARDAAAAADFAREQAAQGRRALALCFEEDAGRFAGLDYVSMGRDARAAAQVFFRLLRENERRYDVIVAVSPEERGVGASLYNRMIKSCGGRVVERRSEE